MSGCCDTSHQRERGCHKTYNVCKSYHDVYTAPTATTARAFCRTLPLTAHGHCAAKYDILDMAR